MARATKKTKRPAKQSEKKTGGLKSPINVAAFEVIQGSHRFYVFKLRASTLWKFVSINRRAEEKDEGYQRVLSTSRLEAVARHIIEGNPLPNSVLIALEGATYSPQTSKLKIPSGTDVGWVIDGQHRIAGAHEAANKVEIDLCVIAFIDVDLEFQIEQFVTINREAKGVPTALVYDLLKHLPARKKPTEVATERAAEIANSLRRGRQSVFGNRIVVTMSPRKGQISITNFVRKVAPHVNPERGILRIYTLPEQERIIDNYFSALKRLFPEQWKKTDNIFFRTIGFGAMMNVFEEIFQTTISSKKGSFKVSDIMSIMDGVSHFDFAQWEAYGSGNKAELQAAQDFRTDFNRSRGRVSSKEGLLL